MAGLRTLVRFDLRLWFEKGNWSEEESSLADPRLTSATEARLEVVWEVAPKVGETAESSFALTKLTKSPDQMICQKARNSIE